MYIFRSIEEVKERLSNPVVTIGNFDGVHLGHREIFRTVKQAAARVGGVSVIVTFRPHPLKVLAPEKSPSLINTYDEKELLIEASGVDYLLVIPFTRDFATISADRFVREILVERLGLKHLVIGYDYAFGRNREGNVEFLQKMGSKLGYTVDVLQPIGNGNVVFSSSLIRKMVSQGNVKDVIPLLGRNYSLGGRVEHGLHRGKELGFPTANIVTEKELIPAYGVYAVKVKVGDAIYDGACNIGDNPTFNGGKTTIEVFILDFDGDLYGQQLRMYFVDKIREERKFADIHELRETIARDVQRCRQILKSASIVEYRQYLEQV